jgi:hypothetical protein
MEAGEFAIFQGFECQDNDSFFGDVIHSETGEILNIFSARYEVADDIDVAGIYRHYKSTEEDERLYLVHGAVRDTQTEEVLVVYEPLYQFQDLLYARPIQIFTETVGDKNDTERFKRIV